MLEQDRFPTIAEMRHDIIIVTRSEAIPVDGFGTIETFTKLDRVWAKIKEIQALKAIDLAQIGIGITHIAWVRWRDDLSSRQWIRWRNKMYKIRGINNMKERNRFAKLLLEEFENVSG